ncbi:MAG: ATP-binding protein [Acidobacteriota bacterium]
MPDSPIPSSGASPRDPDVDTPADARAEGPLDLEPRLGHGIHRRFVVVISLLVALVLVTQGAILVLFGHDVLSRHLEDEASSFAALAVAPIAGAYERYHDSGYGKFLDLYRATAELQHDLVRVELYDVSGRRLFDSQQASATPRRSEPSESSPLAAGDPLLAAVRGLEQVVFRAEVPDRDAVLRVVQPFIEEWGRHQYSVVFSFSYARVQDTSIRAGLWLSLIACIALVLGIGCAYVLSASSLRPLAKLTRHARALAGGTLDRRLALRTGDEFEVLGGTLDRMAARLAASIDALEASNRGLEAANRELQELDRVKSDVLANVSHELKTPLTAIRGYVEAMREGLLGEVTPVQQDSLRVVERNIGRLRSMIDQLLGFARMESGRLTLEPRAFELEPMARHVLEVVRAARGDVVRFELVVERDLPPVQGDPARLAQVLENLLTNAAKFSADPGPENETDTDADTEAANTGLVDGDEVAESEARLPLVTLRLRTVSAGRGGEVEVSVRDHGIGIPAAEQERIFDRFYQVDASSKRPYGGMGLGLAIVREILERHDSSIEVESTEGQGATFRFLVPLADAVPAPAGDAGADETRSLVLVDDDARFVQEMVAHLGDAGWTVHVAATGAEGARLAHRCRPDVIVLDRLLPDQDGFDLLTRLREDEALAEVPIVLCTVRRERALGLRLGAADYWVKPLTPEDFEQRLETLSTPRSGLPDGAGRGTFGV